MDEPPVSPLRKVRGEDPARPILLLRVTAVMVAALLIWILTGWVGDTLPGEGGSGSPTHLVTALMTSVLVLAMVWLARRYLDRRPWSGLRLTGPRQAWWPLLVGVFSWALPALPGVVLALALGASVTPNAPTGEIVTAVLVLVVLVLLVEALPEELICRGYLFRNLNTIMSAWMVVLVQAVLFALWGTLLALLVSGSADLAEYVPLLLGMGVVLGCVRVITGDVWACVGFHVAFMTASQSLRNQDLFVVHGLDTITGTVFLAPFVLGVLTAMLLLRDTGSWDGRVADPVRA